ncbi:hypothetical protein F5984_17380 [Rudanella paleaurantiibacter]|uniref:DUF481 domain-containing protein n=1 Tax=Rudanella paleaurantiibacter TaxID=2614655 RepID=A0A7J5TXT1_9BACT|nr:hypothetical protein [Rudanella paleaurantiibacter]KAB7729387.1 hypothetical protein F5984_17380 [Rudanella paleaurantiibacter]
MKTYYRKIPLLFILFTCAHHCFAQKIDTTIVVRDSVIAGDISPAGIALLSKADSVKSTRYFAGAVSVTNNGISFVPSFNLEKPAVMFDLSLGRSKLTFEPQLWFSAEGKPWTFLFWWRYQLVDRQKFRLRVGAHAAFSFRTLPIVINGGKNEVIEARRYLVGEIAPNYFLTKNISVGMYYLYSRGFDFDAATNGHFLTVNSNFANIKLTNQLFMQIVPQIYYLKLEAQDGFYASSTVILAKRNFPLSLSTIVNKIIQTNIAGSKDFIWNVTLIYSFSKKYLKA